MTTVQAIIFGPDALIIEYTTDSAPFSESVQLNIPLLEAQRHPQLAQDLQEVVQDAETLLDSALMVKVSATTAAREMGRD